MSQIPFEKLRAWIFQDALPFWAGHGWDATYGGFFEELSPNGGPTACDFKRVRVQCRQIYAFSHAVELGWAEGEALSRQGFEYLVRTARTADGGWAKLLARDGSVLDATPDLYDLAFVLFALSWRYRISRDAEALRLMHETLDFIQTRMRSPAGGFWPKLPNAGVHLQNPHMHLTEASIVAFEASGDQRFLDQAREIVALFRTHLFDGRTLGEHFDAAWKRTADEQGRIVEPGHQFEWAWILARYAALTGDDVAQEASALVDFAERFGIMPNVGAVYDVARDDGAPLRTSARAWTTTERIKGWLGVFELTGRDPSAEVAHGVNILFDRYFAGSKPGLWTDQIDGDGRAMVEAVPASIIYHILLAFAEVLRLEPRLKQLQTP